MAEWMGASWAALGWVLVTALGVYLAIIVYTRLAGLRSFAKMSSFDFAMTVAVGSMISTTVLSRSVSLVQGAVGIGAVYVLQIVVAQLRLDTRLHGLFDNEPLLLMAGDRVIDDNLRRGRVTHDDLRSKLREANVLHPSQVRAVILETTGDIAVLHSRDPDEPLAAGVLEDVRGADEYAAQLGVHEDG